MSGSIYGIGNNNGLILGSPEAELTEFTLVDGFSSPDCALVEFYDDTIAVIKTDGSLWMWGDNYYGQLGTGDTIDRTSPVNVLTSVAKVSLSGSVTMAITTTGELYVWGRNTDGRLGLGDSTNRLTPTKLGSATWIDVSANGYQNAAIQSNGTLWTWGSSNFSGNLAYGDTSTSNIPVQIGTDTDWVSVVMSDSTIAVLKSSGVLWMCGNNSCGQLGISNTTTYRYLREITYGGLTFRSICKDNSSNVSSAIGTDGYWYGWGGYNGEADMFHHGNTQCVLYPRRGGSDTSLFDDADNWQTVVGLFDDSWIFVDQDNKLWRAYAGGADTLEQMTDMTITDAFVHFSLLFIVNYIEEVFWTKFDGQTEIA